MIKTEYHIVAVMSGTSLDGLDITDVTFQFDGIWKFDIHHAETIAYDQQWNKNLKQLVSLSPEALKRTDEDYTKYLAAKINYFIGKYDLKNIDFISSHGHTALHRPEAKITYQIGNLPTLAQLTQHMVICDFRVQDVLLGGQGAPLVPIGDRLLFPNYDYCINLGGFANLSTEVNGKRIAYDICPANIVLNHYARILGQDFDAYGNIAQKAKIENQLLDALNKLEFYGHDYPKSLGLEWVMDNVFPLIEFYDLDSTTVLGTITEHIAVQVSRAINKKENASVLLTGGGAYNTFLVSQIQSKTKNNIVVPSNAIIEFKEALIFGLLGVLKIRDEVNCLSSVTGAKHDHSSGKIFQPQKK